MTLEALHLHDLFESSSAYNSLALFKQDDSRHFMRVRTIQWILQVTSLYCSPRGEDEADDDNQLKLTKVRWDTSSEPPNAVYDDATFQKELKFFSKRME